jgi:group I intron endonuclease
MNKNILNKNINSSFVNNNTTRFFSSKLEPFIIYNNSLLNKYNILKDNIDKSGIYRWVNRINNKCYIGSSVNLHSRLLNYYNKNYLNKKLLIRNSHIYRALLLYDYDNFNLEILEYCDRNSVIEREQYYIDLLKPEYNILTKAGSSLGFKHSTETLLKFKDRKLSPEALINLKKAKKGLVPRSPLRKINHLLATGHITNIINIKDNSKKTYNSIRAAARDIGVNHATLINYINTNKLLKGIYLVTDSSIG